MALDENLKNVPLTGNFATRSNGEIYLTGLKADPSTNFSGTMSVNDTTPDGETSAITDGAASRVALLDAQGNITASNQLEYFDKILYTPSISVYQTASLNVSGNANVRGDLFVSGDAVVSGTVSALSGLSVSGNLSAVDAEGHGFVFRRDDDASYENLIKAYDGTITLQAEDDVHLKSNTGEDFARFNENAAVWLYHNDVKKLETATDGVYTSGEARNTEGVTTSSTHSVATYTGTPTLSDFRQPHGAGVFFWASSIGAGTDTASEVKYGEGTTLAGTSSVGRTGANHTDGFYFWDDANDKLNVSSTGIYRIVWTPACTVDANSNAVFKLYINSAAAYTQTYRVHTVTDPHVAVLDWVGPITAGSGAVYLSSKGNSEGGVSLIISSASTLFVQRLA